MGFARENPPSPVRRERIRERVALVPCSVYLQATPILTFPPPDGGRDQVAVAEKRSSEKPISSFSDDLLSIFKHYLDQLLLLQLILQIRIINRRDDDAADAENPFEHDHRHQ